MKALRKQSTSPKDVRVQEHPKPDPAPGELLVQTLACGLCGSDVHAWRQDTGYEWVHCPVTLGHEAVGVVVGTGAGTGSQWIGQRIVPIAIDGCGSCDLCRQGTRQLCLDRTVLGLSFDGTAADLFSIPEYRAVPVNNELPAAVLALTEPLSVALRAVTRLEQSIPDQASVMVSGPGPIGLMAALLLNQRGHRVTLLGAARDEEHRLPLARLLGLETILAEDVTPAGLHGWLEASGAAQALSSAVANIGPGGTIVVAGLFPSIPAVDINVLARNEIQLIGSYGSVAVDYRNALAALEAAPDMWASLVTTFPLTEGTRALQAAADAEAVKVVLLP